MNFVNHVFEHIVSIGYEFETSNLIKLSYQPNGSFVNSDLARTFNENNIPLNDTYYKVINSGEYIEYVSDVDMDGDTPNKKIVMNTLNDISDADFQTDQLKPLCVNKNKNQMYSFQTPTHRYPIYFSKFLSDSHCYTLSITEWTVTYYSPQVSKKIIIDTFTDALERILKMLQSLKEVKGAFNIKHDNQWMKINGTKLFHCPDTNLFFLHAVNYSNRTAPLMEEVFQPQMTFKVECKYLLKVIKQFLNVPMIENEKAWSIKKKLQSFYQEVIKVETCVQQLFSNIPISEEVEKSKVYLFLILYKLYYYVHHHEAIHDKHYLKDYVIFLARHSNLVFYQRIIELIGTEMLFTVINQPDIIKQLYPKNKSAVRNKDVNPDDFGDPTKSFMSYFEFMKNEKDWLMENKLDGYTAQYDLKDDLIMMENRVFYWELLEVLKNKNILKDKFLNFRKIPDILKGLEHVDMIDHIYNPKSKRYVKKCEPGYIRTRKFKCVKNTNKFKHLITI
jgi:hypothetical protein